MFPGACKIAAPGSHALKLLSFNAQQPSHQEMSSLSERSESSGSAAGGQDEAASAVRLSRQKRSGRNRRQDILVTLSELLEDPHCDRITTAVIAKKLGLTEAALYRSYTSKAAMLDALIDFIETTLMNLFAQIREDQALTSTGRIEVMASVLLDFADSNRGLIRLMTGQVLMREDPKLTERVAHILDKLEMGIRQAMREAVLAHELPADFDASGRAGLMMSWIIGRWLRFVLTGFSARPGGISAATLRPFLKP